MSPKGDLKGDGGELLGKSEVSLGSLLRHVLDVVAILDADGTLRYVSPAVEAMLGYAPEEVTGTAVFDYVHLDDLERALGALAETLVTSGALPPLEFRARHADGSWRHVEVVRNNRLDDPAVAGVVINVRDVTERKEAEEALRRSEASLAESQRIAHLGTWEWDLVTGEVWCSEETYRIHGFYPAEGMDLRAKLEEAFFPEDLPRYRGKIDEALSGVAEGYDHEHRIRRPDGEVKWVRGQAEVVRGEGGEPLRMIGTVHDVTERKALEAQLERQAFHDPLTELPNRQLLLDRLGQALKRTGRKKGSSRVAVLFMDLDDFKSINDSLGHQAGDRLLVVVAERIRRCLRPEDTLARFGGDEFVVLLEDVGGPEDAVRVAERIIEGFEGPFLLDDRELYARPSIGIALGKGLTERPEDLMRNADTAMYRAKGEGSGYKVFDPAMYERAMDRLVAENDLRRAVERGEFVVHYQPIVDLQTGGIRSLEALVRWDHPERGLLDPQVFVPLAEESGLVVPMGEQVLREACHRAKEWRGEHPRTPAPMSVNLSAKQLARSDLAQTVERMLEETGLEGSCLTLDVTETIYARVLEGNAGALDRLRETGVKISIDDFGTGYSSLSYLKSLPADVLKVDKSFVGGPRGGRQGQGHSEDGHRVGPHDGDGDHSRGRGDGETGCPVGETGLRHGPRLPLLKAAAPRGSVRVPGYRIHVRPGNPYKETRSLEHRGW